MSQPQRFKKLPKGLYARRSIVTVLTLACLGVCISNCAHAQGQRRTRYHSNNSQQYRNQQNYQRGSQQQYQQAVAQTRQYHSGIPVHSGDSNKRKGKVLVVRGAFTVFSLGLDTLASKLRQHGCDVTVSTAATSSINMGVILKEVKKNPNVGPIVLVGHSRGGLLAPDLAREAREMGIAVDLIVVIDNTWDATVPNNVRRAVNFYHTNPFGVMHGQILKSESKNVDLQNVDIGKLPGRDSAGYIDHFNIEESTWVQDLAIREVLHVCRRASDPVQEAQVVPNNQMVQTNQMRPPYPTVSAPQVHVATQTGRIQNTQARPLPRPTAPAETFISDNTTPKPLVNSSPGRRVPPPVLPSAKPSLAKSTNPPAKQTIAKRASPVTTKPANDSSRRIIEAKELEPAIVADARPLSELNNQSNWQPAKQVTKPTTKPTTKQASKPAPSPTTQPKISSKINAPANPVKKSDEPMFEYFEGVQTSELYKK